MNQAAATLTPGFAQPVQDAQRVFRAVLEAMARPLQPQALAVPLTPPAPLTAEAGGVVLTLCDEQTPLWVDPQLHRHHEVTAWLGFHTGAPLVAAAAEALFCLASSPDAVPPFEDLSPGTDQEPHRSTTLIVQAEQTGSRQRLRGTGPGIREALDWDGHGMTEQFRTARAEHAGGFPRGVDVLITGRGTVTGLPRTTVLEPTGPDTAAEGGA
ncbi:phosphonate C-P lyase system protein PhnH [Nesterenkonia ebinurensis]|uniref:phosphonate C-P lyase system protein PhnH n=1 Tax=Nesterenkonia ebinurensis TaxID=2608252 RepID=UPI00123CBA87|nr:phosphonate C-P lyase system protein PhnH [Nesterenkonia ebinurensis]